MKDFKRGFSLVDSINLEGLALSEDEKYDIRQYIKSILLKSKVLDLKPDKVQNNGLSDSKWDEIRDFDGYDVYGQTTDGYTHLETVKFQDLDKEKS